MTIKDIARLSGVSVSTVSRVLNNKPDVSEACRQKVLSVIEDQNYIPNTSARDLVRVTSDAVGLIVRGIQNPFFTEIILEIEKQLDLAGYSMIMRQISSADDELRAGAVMEREKRLQGIIFLGGRSDYRPEELAAIKVPYVFCTYTNSFGTLDPSTYSSVSIEDEEAACEAVRYLIRKGHRRIASMIAEDDDSSISHLRCRGYRRALEEAGIEADPDLIISIGESFRTIDAYRGMQAALEKKPDFTALFAISDDMAVGAMRALREKGIRIPEDCSVIAIDGISVTEFLYTMLTTYCQPMEELGRKSVELLRGQIEGTGSCAQVVLQTFLRPGESVRQIG